jgi:hypothetical protein
MYPHFSIRGTIDYQAAQFKDLFNSKALSGNITPGFQWDILNYGRLLNNVRLQDARFQELVAVYQQAVLTANKEVEDGLVTFLKAQQRTLLQREAVAEGNVALKGVQDLWKAGLEPSGYTRVAQLLQNQVQLDDTLAQAEGEIALGLIQVYKALGGGWQIRCTECTEPLIRPEWAAPEPCPQDNAAEVRLIPAPLRQIQQTSWAPTRPSHAGVGKSSPSNHETVPRSKDAPATAEDATVLRPEVTAASREQP